MKNLGLQYNIKDGFYENNTYFMIHNATKNVRIR